MRNIDLMMMTIGLDSEDERRREVEQIKRESNE